MVSVAAATQEGGATFGRSWAEDIQKYHAAKATLPWRPEQQTPVKHVTRYEKSREERQYDLVLGKFRDAEKELEKRHDETSKRRHDLEKSRARQLRNVQHFNLINHSPMYVGARDPTDPPVEPQKPRRTSNVDYNIVTNALREGVQSPLVVQSHAPTSPAAKNRRTRDFNILSNKYHERNDQRELDEYTRAKEIAAVKFNKRNNFHPVRIAFYDPDKEAQFLEARAEDQRIHGKDRVAKLPPREQFAEGKIYNIVNQSVINPMQISRYDGHAERAKNKMLQHAFEERIYKYGREVAERDERLCLNRFAHERHTQAFVHGFDPITNQPFDGVNAKQRVSTRTHEALPAWQVLERGVPSTSKIAAHAAQRIQESEFAGSNSPTLSPDTNTRPNILVVDNENRAIVSHNLDASKPSPVIDSFSLIRTGGFQQL